MMPNEYMAISDSDIEGERLYASLLYDRGAADLVSYWQTVSPRSRLGAMLESVKSRGETVENIVRVLRSRLDSHLDSIVRSRSWDNVIVGMTTSFSQLFGNVLLARRIKSVAASAVVVLGGPTVSPAAIADSIVATYPWVDYVVRGEGELAFHSLVNYIAGAPNGSLPKGVVSQTTPSETLWQVADLDELPTPDYDAFFEGLPSRSVALPVEGSRGCWWDRTTKNPKSTCQFCNLNIQWDGYRQRSGAKVAQSIRELSDKYHSTNIAFLDNIVRVKGFDEFVESVGSLTSDIMFFHEARANLRPQQILRLFDAGLRVAQFGLEGLSSSFLHRINKGTTTIMNLEVMKTCAELGIRSSSNLIVDFPSSTKGEVDETVEVIDRYAFAYEPPTTVSFELGIDSAAMRYASDFGIENVRNHDRYKSVVDHADFSRLVTFQKSFDLAAEPVSWAPVISRVDSWRREYRRHLLWYRDGGTFIHVFREHPQGSRVIELIDDEATVYRYCLQIRALGDICAILPVRSRDYVEGLLTGLVSNSIMFAEGKRYLSLALAPDPHLAARRIRTMSALSSGQSERRSRLTVTS
jgi:ribosomal peptide maturation radical SAM protein 1